MNILRRFLLRRTIRKGAKAADAYLGSGLAAFAAQKQAERAALTHEQADAIAQRELWRYTEWPELLDRKTQEFHSLYPTWKGWS